MKKKEHYVYKYYSFSDNSLSAIEKKYFYFSRPEQLNDPYDVSPRFVYDYRKETYNPIRTKETIAFKDEKYIKFRNMTRIFSTTTDRRNILMWGHYADKHTGFCIKIRLQEDNDLLGIQFRADQFKEAWDNHYRKGFLPMIEINYIKVNERKEINVLAPPIGEAVQKQGYEKFEAWQYEKEYRCTILEEKIRKQTVNFNNDETIAGVIFGANSTKNNQKLLRNAFKYYSNKIKYYKAEIRTDLYEVKINPL